jgi:hypothetical protein
MALPTIQERERENLRVHNAEPEAIGDYAGDVLGQVGELRLDFSELRRWQRRQERLLLAADDTC